MITQQYIPLYGSLLPYCYCYQDTVIATDTVLLPDPDPMVYPLLEGILDHSTGTGSLVHHYHSVAFESSFKGIDSYSIISQRQGIPFLFA